MENKYRIKDFLTRIKDKIDIIDGIQYKRVTIKTNHKGVLLRNITDGSDIGTKKQFKIKKGNFILSKIDARNGAFGIIPDELDDAIITGNFWTYEVDQNIVNIDLFLYLTNSFKFIDICKKASTGSTHRKYLSEDKFLNQIISIPEKEKQIEIVKIIKECKKLQDQIENNRNHGKQLMQAVLNEAFEN